MSGSVLVGGVGEGVDGRSGYGCGGSDCGEARSGGGITEGKWD